jgi:hypothetical protein
VGSLAEVLATCTLALADAEARRSAYRLLSYGTGMGFVQAALPGLSAAAAGAAADLVRRFRERGDGAGSVALVLLHHDFHLDDMVFAEPFGSVSGVPGWAGGDRRRGGEGQREAGQQACLDGWWRSGLSSQIVPITSFRALSWWCQEPRSRSIR